MKNLGAVGLMRKPIGISGGLGLHSTTDRVAGAIVLTFSLALAACLCAVVGAAT